MADVPSLVEAVGALTVAGMVQQIITGALDERRKRAAAKREARREPLDRRHLEIGTHAEADALADAENDRLLKRIARQEATIRDQQAELDTKDAEIAKKDATLLEQRAELAQLYRDLYNSDRRRPP